LKGYSVQPVTYDETKSWLLHRHYAKRMPQIQQAYGLYCGADLVGVVTYGIPASNHLCRGLAGVEYANIVWELNRLCLLNNKKNEASYLISQSLKKIESPKIVVSYADTKQGHIGFCYQATNFYYSGHTDYGRKPRFDRPTGRGHSRHHKNIDCEAIPRKSKHRYIYFVGTKRQKKEMKAAFRYPILPYPKGETRRYEVPETQERQLRLFA